MLTNNSNSKRSTLLGRNRVMVCMSGNRSTRSRGSSNTVERRLALMILGSEVLGQGWNGAGGETGRKAREPGVYDS